jgi:hypothetical protein
VGKVHAGFRGIADLGKGDVEAKAKTDAKEQFEHNFKCN